MADAYSQGRDLALKAKDHAKKAAQDVLDDFLDSEFQEPLEYGLSTFAHNAEVVAREAIGKSVDRA